MKTLVVNTRISFKSILAIAILAATAITITLNVPDGTTIADVSIKTGISAPTSGTVAAPHSATTAYPPSATAVTGPRSTTTATPTNSTVTTPQSQTAH